MSHARTISFRTQTEKIKLLDGLAALQDRDRTYLINEALDYYLDLNQYHLSQIREGLQQANAGKLMDHADLKHKFARRRSKK